ncbi:hypothetical protein EDD85DRAFT_787504 [Armillaria nabsnona]|nr:hypothetical protein EDD85DRAFT_787504 [Armillaria nabsnona]
MFMSVLHGTNNVHLLYAAWTGLRKRLECGDHFLYKFADQYRLGERPQSPTSMDAGLYDQLDEIRDPTDRIRQALKTVSFHRSILKEQGAELLSEGEGRWEHIIPPNKSFRLAFSSYSERLAQAKNQQDKELKPQAVVSTELQQVTLRAMDAIKPETLLNLTSGIMMNIHTLFKDIDSKFFQFSYPINTQFSSYEFRPSVSLGLRPEMNLPNPDLSTVKENNLEVDEREVSRILRRYEYSQDQEQLREHLQAMSQNATPDKGKSRALFNYTTATIAHISPIPSTASPQESI